MFLKARKRAIVWLVAILAMLAGVARTQAQAALFMEEPYGLFGALNPTGHNAIYFSRICAETPIELRRCKAGEQGVVISRYQGIDGYDWVAIPLIPYLYSVDDASEVPQRVDKAMVHRLRDLYHEDHLEDLSADVPPGNFWRGGPELRDLAATRDIKPRITIFAEDTYGQRLRLRAANIEPVERHLVELVLRPVLV